MLPPELKTLTDSNYDIYIVDCLNTSQKQIRYDMYVNITTSNNILSSAKKQIIFRDAYLLDSNSIDYIFEKSRNKIVYLINLNTNQERNLMKKYRNKYKYYNCVYDPNKDNFFLYLKQLMFQQTNRYKLMNSTLGTNVKVIMDYIGYNLPFTNLSVTDMRYNYNLLHDLYRYLYKIPNNHILNNIIINLRVPTFGTALKFPPKHQKLKKIKKEKKMTKQNLEKLASEKMITYFERDIKWSKTSTDEDGLF